MNFEKLSRYLDTLGDADIKHFTCCVAKDHEVIYTKAVGFNDYEEKIPADMNRIYIWYSVTKVITCTAAMQLVAKGKLSIDDPVYKYLPSYKNLTVETKEGVVPAQTVMTVRHLFTMTSGFGGRRDNKILSAVNKVIEKDPNAGTVALMDALASEPLDFEPGSHYKYGMSHDILAAVVEVASGQKFSDYLKENIFDPLGMSDFTFYPTKEQIDRFCAKYTYDTGLNVSTPIECPTFYGYTPNYEAGGAGLYGSPLHFLALADALACDGIAPNGYEILPKEYLMMMKENLLDETPLSEFRKSPRKYGYGWGLCGRVHMSPSISLSRSPKGEFGWDGAAGSFVLIDTDNKLSMFFSMHTMHCSYAYEKIHTNVRDLVYEALKEE